MHTYGTALDLVGTTVPDHLAADAAVPLLTGPQAQGDLLVVPVNRPDTDEWRSVPPDGVQLVHGEATGNTHWLHCGFDSPGVTWCRPDREDPDHDPLVVALLRVPDGQSALLIHTDEHGANGIGPGSYEIRRKRQLDAVSVRSRPVDDFVAVPQVRPRPRTTFVAD
jgi:hypothetical protein